MNTNTLLFQNAKYVFLNPTDQWKDTAAVVKDTAGVYALVNKVNGKVYIGSSINLYYRLRDYQASWYITTYPDLLISKAIVKYGFINFAILILKVTDKDSTLKAEQHHLDMFKPEYNLLKQAGRPVGYKHTEESKAKIRARHLERVWGDNVKVTDTSTGEIISLQVYSDCS